jgi:hypothetical protein
MMVYCLHRICPIQFVCTHVRLTCLQIPGYGKNALRKQLQYESSYIDTMLEGLKDRIDTEVCHIYKSVCIATYMPYNSAFVYDTHHSVSHAGTSSGIQTYHGRCIPAAVASLSVASYTFMSYNRLTPLMHRSIAFVQPEGY